MSDEDWNEVIRTNLDGTYNVCRAAAMALMRHGSGCLIAMASVSGIYGNATQSNYAAPKAGIIGFTKSPARAPSSPQRKRPCTPIVTTDSSPDC
jgi:3-oxoacyl-[acyl-carrier protein] reductase